MSTRLVIARHGNTFGPGDVVCRVGVTDLPLVASGLQQGYQLGLYLRQHQLMPDVIFTSTLQRTRQTAEQAQQAMQTALPTQSLSMFDEIDYGPDENQPEESVRARLGEATLTAWETQATVPPGWRVNPEAIIRAWHQFGERLQQAYAGKTVLVVTSNGILRFAPHLTGDFATFASQHAIKVATGAFCVFEPSSSEAHWHCLAWNVKPAPSG